MEDQLEIPRAKRSAPKAAEPAPAAPTGGKRVRFVQHKHLNGDAFFDTIDVRPRDMKPGDVEVLKAHRADELERKGVVVPA